MLTAVLVWLRAQDLIGSLLTDIRSELPGLLGTHAVAY